MSFRREKIKNPTGNPCDSLCHYDCYNKTMTDTILRQIEMLRRIPMRPGKVTAEDLERALAGEGLEIHRRSVQRDLIKLSTIFPLVSDGAKPAGWSWNVKNLLDIPSMSPSAALTFQLVAAWLKPMFPPPVLDNLAPYFQRATAVLQEQRDSSFQAWSDKIYRLPRRLALGTPVMAEHIIEPVYLGLLHDRKLQITYLARGESETATWQFNPRGLVVADEIIYLVGSIYDYKDERHIALHRVLDATLLDETITPHKSFRLSDYVAEGAFSYGDSEMEIDLVARFDKEAALHLQESPLSPSQELHHEGDWTVVKARVKNSARLRWWLLGFGEQVEILEPESLRSDFADIAGAMVSLYANKPGG